MAGAQGHMTVRRKPKDGVNGTNGTNGIPGCILRQSEWAAGVEYRNDESLTSGTRYLDIAIVTSSANTFKAYKCKKTHTSSSSIPVTNTTYWEVFNSLVPVYTPLIMAQNALLRFTQTNQLLVMKSDNTTVAAGMGGGDYPLWAGAVTPANAPFKVSIAGKLYSTDAEISGKITASSGKIGDFSINGGKLKIDGGRITYQGYNIDYNTVIQADEYRLSSTCTKNGYTTEEQIMMIASSEYGAIGLLNVSSNKTCTNVSGGYMGQPCCLQLNAQAINPPSHRYDHAYIVRSTWGEFAGLRPAIRRIEGTTAVSDFQLSNLDYVVVVNKSIGDNSILFPLYPAVGQTYIIIKATSSGKIALNYNGKTAIEYNKKQYTYYDGSLNTTVDVFDSSQTGIKQFIWDGAKWHVFTLTVSHTVHTYSNNSD